MSSQQSFWLSPRSHAGDLGWSAQTFRRLPLLSCGAFCHARWRSRGRDICRSIKCTYQLVGLPASLSGISVPEYERSNHCTGLCLRFFINCLGGRPLSRLTNRLEDEEKFRKLAVDELAHRLKNKLATIQSIISFQLRDEPPVRDAILVRLNALSATDDTYYGGARMRRSHSRHPFRQTCAIWSTTNINGGTRLLP